MKPSAATTTVLEIDRTPDVKQPVDLAWLRDHVRRAIEWLPSPATRIAISLVDDASMIELHARHMNLHTTTDVLTFPASPAGQPIDVDIALCVDEASRRTTEFDHSIERELLLYALHGLLHCCGFDDHDETSHTAMHAEEDRILAAIGVGSTFAVKSKSVDSLREAASGGRVRKPR